MLKQADAIQDAFAILLAAQCPRLHLLGISTVHGNASLKNVTKNTAGVLEAIGRRDVPLYSGAAKPFCREVVHAAAIHGESGLGGVTLLPDVEVPVQDKTAVEAMYHALIRTPPNTAWLVSTGALTNVALLFAVHPDLVGHIQGLSIMGGAVGGFFTHAPMGRMRERLQLSQEFYQGFNGTLPDFTDVPALEVAAKLRELGILGPAEKGDEEHVHLLLEQARHSFGNWTPFAEFNIYCDPEAAYALFTNRALASKTTLIPLDLTHQVCADARVLERLRGPGNSGGNGASEGDGGLRAMLTQVVTFFAQTYLNEFGMEAPPLHDPVAVAAVLAPSLFVDNGERFEVFVVTEGDDGMWEHQRTVSERVGQCGRTVVKLLDKGTQGVRIPRTLACVETFWEMLELSVARAEQGVKG